MTTKSFVEFEDPYADLSEISQSGYLKMAFASKISSDEYRTQHLFVKCRDFLNDAVIGSHGGYRTPEIYGFTYDGEKDPIDSDKTRLIMRLSLPEKDLFRANLNKFNNMLQSTQMDRTRCWAIKRKGGNNAYSYLLVEGDPRWTNHVTATSFYTLMLRVMTTRAIQKDETFAQWLRNVHKFNVNDRNYLEDFVKVFDHPADFIKNMELLSMEDVHLSVRETDEMESAHERCGIQEFSKLVYLTKDGGFRYYVSNYGPYCYTDDYPSEEAIRNFWPILEDVRRFA